MFCTKSINSETGFLVFYISNYDLKFAQIWGNYNEKHRNNGFKRKLFQIITDYFIRFELLFTVSNYLTHGFNSILYNTVRLSSANIKFKARNIFKSRHSNSLQLPIAMSSVAFHVFPLFSRTIATIFLLKISRSTFFSIATLHIPTIS